MHHRKAKLGKLFPKQVLSKLKKNFLKKKSVAKIGKAEVSKKAGKPAGEEAKYVVGEGPLKGKLVRVVNETSLYCGRVVEVLGHAKDKIHGQIAWAEASASFFE